MQQATLKYSFSAKKRVRGEADDASPGKTSDSTQENARETCVLHVSSVLGEKLPEVKCEETAKQPQLKHFSDNNACAKNAIIRGGTVQGDAREESLISEDILPNNRERASSGHRITRVRESENAKSAQSAPVDSPQFPIFDKTLACELVKQTLRQGRALESETPTLDGADGAPRAPRTRPVIGLLKDGAAPWRPRMKVVRPELKQHAKFFAAEYDKLRQEMAEYLRTAKF